MHDSYTLRKLLKFLSSPWRALENKLLIGDPAQYLEMKLVLLQARRAPTINAIYKRVKILFHVRSELFDGIQPLSVALIII